MPANGDKSPDGKKVFKDGAWIYESTSSGASLGNNISLSAIYPQTDEPLNLFVTGQSNIQSALTTVDLFDSNNVYFYDFVDDTEKKHTWSRGQIRPDGTVGLSDTASWAFSYAHRLAARTGRRVNVLLVSVGGTPIREWIPSQTTDPDLIINRITEGANALGWDADTTLFRFLWGQGEADFSRPQYGSDFGEVMTYLESLPWFKPETPRIIMELADRHLEFGGPNDFFQTLQYSADRDYTVLPSRNLETVDGTHFSADALHKLGLLALDATIGSALPELGKAPPISVPPPKFKWHHEHGTSSGGIGTNATQLIGVHDRRGNITTINMNGSIVHERNGIVCNEQADFFRFNLQFNAFSDYSAGFVGSFTLIFELIPAAMTAGTRYSYIGCQEARMNVFQDGVSPVTFACSVGASDIEVPMPQLTNQLISGQRHLIVVGFDESRGKAFCYVHNYPTVGRRQYVEVDHNPIVDNAPDTRMNLINPSNGNFGAKAFATYRRIEAFLTPFSKEQCETVAAQYAQG